MNVREIAAIAFGRARKGILVSIQVYFDGAGKEENHPVITVGGFLADADLCQIIEDEWDAATGGRLFHLADFGTPYCKLGSGKWDASERVEFLKKLAAIVNRPGCTILSASIEVEPYNDLLSKSPHAHVNGPAFSGCAQAAVALAEFILLKEDRRQQKVHYVFEKGDRQHEIAKMIADWDDINSSLSGLRGLGFEPKETTTLLQPADLVAGIVKSVMLSAHKALSCLDNGMSRTALINYRHHYSRNGVTSAVVSGHDEEHCFVINSKTFTVLDEVSTEFFDKHPTVLAKRMAQSPFKPKPQKKRVNK